MEASDLSIHNFSNRSTVRFSRAARSWRSCCCERCFHRGWHNQRLSHVGRQSFSPLVLRCRPAIVATLISVVVPGILFFCPSFLPVEDHRNQIAGLVDLEYSPVSSSLWEVNRRSQAALRLMRAAPSRAESSNTGLWEWEPAGAAYFLRRETSAGLCDHEIPNRFESGQAESILVTCHG